ncbi:MAG: RluA family pseudouridine synthase [Candidatus Binatia bacterium]
MSEGHEQTRRFVVEASASGRRLDQWLSECSGVPTRSQLRADIRSGRVSVDGVVAKAALRLRGGELVELRRVERSANREGGPVPQDLPLEILFEDDTVIAVNKPAGMVVHPAAGNKDGTLVNALLHRYPDLSGAEQGRAGLIHRLDKDTSGVVLAARTPEAHEALAKQFRDRAVVKQYLALVAAKVAQGGRVDLPLGRHPRERKKISTASRRARSAVTDYEVLERFSSFTLLLVKPQTGRTHQIRVHLAARGWPIVQDPLYGGRKAVRTLVRGRLDPAIAAVVMAMPRQALHAWRITVSHPSGGKLTIEAPLPADYSGLIDGLRGCCGSSFPLWQAGVDEPG